MDQWSEVNFCKYGRRDGFRSTYEKVILTMLAAMKSQVTPQALVEVLDQLCYVCPKGEYTEKCPFPKFSGVSRASRMAHFGAMDREQVESLFALATDCSCPSDPGRKALPLPGAAAGGGL